MSRFRIREFPDRKYDEMADAVQEAEFVHAETGQKQFVLAVADEPPFFSKDEVVYESKGGE